MCVSLYRPYSTQNNVCITVPSLFHSIQCVYHCVVPIALDEMCESLNSPYCNRCNVCISVPSLLHLMQCMYHCIEYQVFSPFVLYRKDFIFVSTVLFYFQVVKESPWQWLRTLAGWDESPYVLTGRYWLFGGTSWSDLHDVFFHLALWSGDTSSLRKAETDLNGVGVKLIGIVKFYTADMWLFK